MTSTDLDFSGDISVQAESFPDRLKQAIKYAGGVKDVSALLETGQSTLYGWMKGVGTPPVGFVYRLCEVANVYPDWLLTGAPPVSPGDDSGALARAVDKDEDEFVRVSLFDVHASAGPGAIATTIEQPVAIKFRADWLSKRGVGLHDLQAIRVRGDSMEPTLKNGDLIVVDTMRTTPADGIYVIAHDDEVQVKRLQRLSPTRLVIASDNPLAGNTEIDLRDETQHPRIIGRVIWLGRDL